MTERVIGESVVISLEEFKKIKEEKDKGKDKITQCFDRIMKVLQEEGYTLNIRSTLVQISPGTYRTIINLDFISREEKA